MTLSIGRHHEESIIIIDYKTLDLAVVTLDAKEAPSQDRRRVNYRFHVKAPPQYLIFRLELAMSTGICSRCSACRGCGKVFDNSDGSVSTCGLCAGTGLDVDEESLREYMEAKGLTSRVTGLTSKEDGCG